MLYICIWNIFLLTGCAKTEMVSELTNKGGKSLETVVSLLKQVAFIMFIISQPDVYKRQG